MYKKLIPVVINGQHQEVPALSPYWVSKRRVFMLYRPLPTVNQDGMYNTAKLIEWTEVANLLITDLTWLLELEHHRFWSQVYFKNDSLSGVISLFCGVTPRYLQSTFTTAFDQAVSDLYEKLFHLAFLVIVRLTTTKESEAEYLSEKEHGDMLYNQFLITMPLLMSFCAIYRADNNVEVAHVVSTVFRIQQKYFYDLQCAGKTIMRVLAIHDKDQLSRRAVSGQCTANQTALDNDIRYVYGICDSVLELLEAYPPACMVFHSMKVELSVASYYESSVTRMARELHNFKDESFLYSRKRIINIIRVKFIEIFRKCFATIINDIMEPPKKNVWEESKLSLVEDLCDVLCETLAERSFMCDYNTLHPVKPELIQVAEICPDYLDTMKIDFIMDGVISCCNSRSSILEPTTKDQVAALPSNGHQKREEEGRRQMSGNEITSVQQVLLVSEVKDILPHLGEGFIQICLKYYEYSSTAVINAVLEDSLPAYILSYDTEMPFIPPELEYVEPSSGLPERLNVFDNDEFDIMTRDTVDISRIHRGKKDEKHQSLEELLDDKKHLKDKNVRERFNQLGLSDETENETVGMYDDDYDDSYDVYDVSVREAGDLGRRRFVVPRVLRVPDRDTSNRAHSSPWVETAALDPKRDQFISKPVDQSAKYEDRRRQAKQVRDSGRPGQKQSVLGRDTEDDGESSSWNKAAVLEPKKDLFLPNPAEQRAKFEERRQAKQEWGGRRPEKKQDVIGKPKGLGQEKEVVINRERKGVQKAFRGNHNRRDGAQHKRNQGMF